MDLHNWLEQSDSDLYRAVLRVRKAAEPRLERPLHRHYTDHSVKHSVRVIEKLGELAEGIMGSDSLLSPIEVYVLLAAAYLHDIGMQDERSAGSDLDEIRKRHHELTERIILQSMEQSGEAAPLNIEDIPGIANVIALVAKAHREVDLSQDRDYRGFPHGGTSIRPRLLAALLRVADELDIDHRRAPMAILDNMEASPASQLHWYKCYYVTGTAITDGYVEVWYQFPRGEKYTLYNQLIPKLVHPKLSAALSEVRAILKKHGVQVVLDEPMVRDVAGLRTMPAEVELIALQECNEFYDKEIRLLAEERSRIPSLPSLDDPVISEILHA